MFWCWPFYAPFMAGRRFIACFYCTSCLRVTAATRCCSPQRVLPSLVATAVHSRPSVCLTASLALRRICVDADVMRWWLWCVCVFVCRQCAAGWWSTTWRRRRSSRAAPSSPASSRSRSAAAVSRRLFATRFLGDDVILLYMYDVTKTRVESVCSRMEMYQLGLRK